MTQNFLTCVKILIENTIFRWALYW